MKHRDICRLFYSKTQLYEADSSSVLRQLFPTQPPHQCLSADPKEFETSSQGIRGYMSVLATLKFIYFSIKYVIFFTNNRGTPCVYLVCPLTLWRRIFFLQILAHSVFKM